MVTKPSSEKQEKGLCSVLAKIHMVTKQDKVIDNYQGSSVLAKIHMVTKPTKRPISSSSSSVLAKIHMVTKLKSHLR